PFPGKEYPPHLTGAAMDGVLREVFAKIAELQASSEPSDPVERCRGFWAELRRIYVTDPADAHRADWGRCELPLDRSAPYGGAREWAMLLDEARLVTVEGGGHAPWIEAPELVLGSIATFLDGD